VTFSNLGRRNYCNLIDSRLAEERTYPGTRLPCEGHTRLHTNLNRRREARRFPLNQPAIKLNKVKRCDLCAKVKRLTTRIYFLAYDVTTIASLLACGTEAPSITREELAKPRQEPRLLCFFDSRSQGPVISLQAYLHERRSSAAWEFFPSIFSFRRERHETSQTGNLNR